MLKRDELKKICQILDLDDSGRRKEPLIDRILGSAGRKPEAMETPKAKPPPKQSTAGKTTVTTKTKTKRARKASSNNNGANLGFEQKLWAAADKISCIETCMTLDLV